VYYSDSCTHYKCIQISLFHCMACSCYHN
jgi:hypothetical protein